MSLWTTILTRAGGFAWQFEVLQSNPDWYFKSTDLEYWVSNLFNTPVEVHTFQLGLLVGILFGALAAQHYPKLSVLALVSLVGFLFGAFELPFLCQQRTQSCAHIRLKPWYFLSGLILTQFSVLTVTNSLAALKPGTVSRLFQSKEHEDQQ